MRGILSWLTDPKGGTPLVAVLAGGLSSVLATVLGLPQTGVDACLRVLSAVVDKGLLN